MTNAHYIYLLSAVTDVEKVVKDHQADFDELINDTFSEAELLQHEALVDSIGAIFVQPLFTEMTFEDFYPDLLRAESQRAFFDNCRSSICVENMPDFFLNPFQVTYLIELLRNFDEVLIDRGSVEELEFKQSYLEKLKKYKNIFSLLTEVPSKPLETKTTKPVDPIDFLLGDVYREIEKLQPSQIEVALIEKPEKLLKTYQALKDEKLDASALLKKSGLNAKDFDDNLEKLKFLLRKLN